MASIPIEIKNSRIVDAKDKIFTARPIPLDEDDGTPLYTDIEWVSFLAREYLRVLYDRGVFMQARAAASDNDIFEE